MGVAEEKDGIFKGLDYYPFGAEKPGRAFNSGEYKYSVNGQEKTDEISGEGNHNTALFWEYDTRLGRRWNRDIQFSKIPEWSPYACFADNPIIMIDTDGDLWKISKGENGKTNVKWITSEQFYGADSDGNLNPELTNPNKDDIYTMFAEKVYDQYQNVTSVNVYNEDGTTKNYDLNEYGLIQMQDGQNNINNYSPNDVETTEGDMYLNPDAAVALYNTIGEFRMNYPGSTINIGDASTSKGDSPKISTGSNTKHATHYRGNAFDLQYLDKNGSAIKINVEPTKFSKPATQSFLNIAKQNGLSQQYVGTDSKFSGMSGSQVKGHNDHFHVGIKPVQKTTGGLYPYSKNNKHTIIPSDDF